MTKNTGSVIVSLVLFSLLLSGCKLPASTAPDTSTPQVMTTPIRIQTDTPEWMAQTEVAQFTETEQPDTGEEPLPAPTDTLEPTEVVVVPTVTRPTEYTLQEGEFPFCIARRFDLNPEDLLALNNLEMDELVSPGTTLQIPQTGSWQGEGRVRNPHPTTHTVTAGETIYSIACFYGDVSPEAIVAVNNLEEPYDLTPGQTLSIP
jgi:LysM repeat protein